MANDEPDVATRLKSSNLPGVVRLVKMSNMLNAILLCVAGVFAFILNSLSPLVIISGLYIIIFSCMLCCFELHLARFEKAIFRNFGFMFKWGGRCAFFFFVGTLAFGVGIVGIVAGAYTFVNVFLNIYVLRKNPYYKKYVEQQEAEMMSKAYSNQTSNVSILQTAKTAAKIAKKTNMSASQAAAVGAVVVGIAANEQMNTAPAPAAKKGKKQEWVQYMDEESGQPYWHNPATNETTWEHP